MESLTPPLGNSFDPERFYFYDECAAPSIFMAKLSLP